MKPEGKFTDSGIEIKKIYARDALSASLTELPGEFPFTRGLHPEMYRSKPWNTCRHAAFDTLEDNNEYYHQLLQQNITELTTNFHINTQLGYCSDYAMPGMQSTGVAIDSLEDMETLFKSIPLEKVSTTITSSATGFILLAFYIAMAKKQGVDLHKMRGTLQNDILKDYLTTNRYIYPLRPSMRIATDVFEWSSKVVPVWNLVSVSGSQLREAGCNAVQEIAFTLSNGKAYVTAALKRGLDINTIGKRLVFTFNANSNLFEEVAKFRAARRIWATVMKDLGATDKKAMMLRFHTQTSSGSLNAGPTVTNISRTTIQAMSAILGGTQSLYANGDETALSKSSDENNLRLQQMLACESGIGDTADPLAGSYFVEALTDEITTRAKQIIHEIDLLGGSVSAIEQGYMQAEIQQNASKPFQDTADNKNLFSKAHDVKDSNRDDVGGLKADDSRLRKNIEKLESLRRRRNPAKCDSVLQGLNDLAASDENIMPAVIEAAENNCTLGEIADTLREVFGEQR